MWSAKWWSLAAVVAATLTLGPASQASLRVPVPVGPRNGASVQALPAFAWSTIPGADHYEFQIAADSGFNSQVPGSEPDQFVTRNTRATLKSAVPNGTYWWRVRAVSKGGAVSRWSSTRSVKKAWTAAPVLRSPVGATVTYPDRPLVLTWSGVPRAAKYLVSLASDPDLGTVLGGQPVETAATSYTPAVALAAGKTYYWGVTPLDAGGNRGKPSRVARFQWEWPSKTATHIADLIGAPEVFDPQFTWDPVRGAIRYEVDVNSSEDFAPGSRVCCTTPVAATSLSPKALLKDNSYYWRVRAFDADGNAGEWNVGPSFRKVFDKAPEVSGPSIKNLHMRDNVGDPGPTPSGYQTQVPIAVWDPVPGASSYDVDVAPYAGFYCDWGASPRNHWRVTTSATAWTPLGTGLRAAQPYPDRMSVAVDGAALVPGQSYCVRIRAESDRDSTGGQVYGDFTCMNQNCDAPAFTFTGFPAAGPFGYLDAADYFLPARGVTTGRLPLFTWRAGSRGQSYFVIVAKDPSFSNIVDYAFTQIPAYAPRAGVSPRTYSDETTSYYWVVLPASNFDGSGSVGNPAAGAPADFQKRSTPPAQILPAAGANLTGAPTFRWTPVEGARRYRLQVAHDDKFGNPIEDVLTDSTAYTTIASYPADQSLFWRVRADDENTIGLTWSDVRTFHYGLQAPVPDQSNPRKGEMIPTWTWSPVPGAMSYDLHVDLPNGTRRDFYRLRSTAIAATTMTGTGIFRWKVRANFPSGTFGVVPGPYSNTISFVRTIAKPTGARVRASRRSCLFSWNPKRGAKTYRLQVSSRPDFDRIVDTVITDTTSYAPLLSRYQYAGRVFYWRVAAVDADGNRGDYTTAQRFKLRGGRPR
jgi:hypothetical protein